MSDDGDVGEGDQMSFHTFFGEVLAAGDNDERKLAIQVR
jgi:hypothetical protein